MKATNTYKNHIRILLFCVFISKHVFLQAQLQPQINTELPQISPPSPTVAAFMKFEEVPVNNYTGIPDISIPIYNVPTRSKDISLDISLKYHPSSIAADEVASYVGLGWNLFAGGTISRTVRGIPDEMYQSGGLIVPRKIGIYHSENTYDSFIDNLYYGDNNSVDIEKHLYNTHIKDSWDSQSDLYQFNFMGNMGRFYIKKNKLTGKLEIMKLDNSNIKIDYNYGNNYTPESFVVYDENGYKYIFDILETSIQSSATRAIKILGEQDDSFSNSIEYISAFHLSRVYDKKNNLLLNFTYVNSKERTVKTTHTYNYYLYPTEGLIQQELFYYECITASAVKSSYPPKEILDISTQTTSTKVLKKIESLGFAKIEFDLEQSREDYNIRLGEESHKLKKILIKDWNNNLIKQFEMTYSYISPYMMNNDYGKRLILNDVTEISSGNLQGNKYKLFYKQAHFKQFWYKNVQKDYWGYFNIAPPGHSGKFYEVDKNYCMMDVLHKMTLPTGGCILFDFESNRYSHVGDQLLPDFYDNPDNWTETTQSYTFDNLQGTAVQTFYPYLMIGNPNIITEFVISPAAPENSGFRYEIRKIVDDSVVSQGGFNCPNANPACTFSLTLNASQYLFVSYASLTRPFLAGALQIKKRAKSEMFKFLYGGGIRIKKIRYFENDSVGRNYYELGFDYFGDVPLVSEKEISYTYNFFDQLNKSSGSLTYPKPVFSFEIFRRAAVTRPECMIPSGGDVWIKTYTSFNNLSFLRTHGSDVGYKNVTVSEKGNGKIQYTYTSSIDVPEFLYSIDYPFLPPTNRDYKRGLLLEESYFNNIDRLLKKVSCEYSYEDKEEVTGVKTYYISSNCPFANGVNYDSYSQIIPDPYNCLPISSLIGNFPMRESFGWSKLIGKTTKEYFYNGNVQHGIVESNERYEYNGVNKKLSLYEKEVYKNGNQTENIKFDYRYSNLGSQTINRISEIQEIREYKDGELLNRQKIDFPDSPGYLPSTVSTSKGNNSLEVRMRYTAYDAYSNVLEVRKENGTPVSYIWGYNHTQPVAMLDNMAYSGIPANLITAIHTASNNQDETALLSALEALRNSPQLSDAQVTTYTYKPLIGVSTITDPKGYHTTYHYDGFGRLQQVKDMEGNTLTENQYHYRPHSENE